MRSVAFSIVLIAALAGNASAQASRITAPIQKARAAASASNARLETQQAAGETNPVRDSVPRAAASSAKPSAAPAGVTAPAEAVAAPTKPAASTKPASTPAKPAAASVTPAPAFAAPAPGSDKNAVATPPAQATGKTPVPNGTKGAAPAATPAPAPAKDVTPAPAKPSSMVEAAPADTVATVSIGSRNPRDISISREVFQYDAAGRRDPFVSLLNTADLRPLLTDLVLVSIIHDARGGNSVAILRDAKTKDQYRVRPGQLIGRMRVTAIEPKRVLFTIDEFGFSRQETLVFSDSTNVRKQ